MLTVLVLQGSSARTCRGCTRNYVKLLCSWNSNSVCHVFNAIFEIETCDKSSVVRIWGLILLAVLVQIFSAENSTADHKTAMRPVALMHNIFQYVQYIILSCTYVYFI